jgi:hypothetical protein
MNGDDLLWDFLEGLALNAPTLITLAVGAAISLTHWERNPAVALFGSLGFVWLSLALIATIAWNRLLVPELFPQPDLPTEKVSYLVLSGVEAVGFIFLMIAAFVYRRRPRRLHDDDEPHPDEYRPRY